jgi:ribosomal protein S19E (S16A)
MNGLRTIQIRRAETFRDTASRRELKRQQMAPRARSLAQSERIAARVSEFSVPNASAALRLSVLRRLDQFGSQEARDIPHAWPVTGAHVRAAVRQLRADGLVELDTTRAGRANRLTAHGRRVLDEIDWTETVQSMTRDGEL